MSLEAEQLNAFLSSLSSGSKAPTLLELQLIECLLASPTQYPRVGDACYGGATAVRRPHLQSQFHVIETVKDGSCGWEALAKAMYEPTPQGAARKLEIKQRTLTTALHLPPTDPRRHCICVIHGGDAIGDDEEENDPTLNDGAWEALLDETYAGNEQWLDFPLLLVVPLAFADVGVSVTVYKEGWRPIVITKESTPASTIPPPAGPGPASQPQPAAAAAAAAASPAGASGSGDTTATAPKHDGKVERDDGASSSSSSTSPVKMLHLLHVPGHWQALQPKAQGNDVPAAAISGDSSSSNSIAADASASSSMFGAPVDSATYEAMVSQCVIRAQIKGVGNLRFAALDALYATTATQQQQQQQQPSSTAAKSSLFSYQSSSPLPNVASSSSSSSSSFGRLGRVQLDRPLPLSLDELFRRKQALVDFMWDNPDVFLADTISKLTSMNIIMGNEKAGKSATNGTMSGFPIFFSQGGLATRIPTMVTITHDPDLPASTDVADFCSCPGARTQRGLSLAEVATKITEEMNQVGQTGSGIRQAPIRVQIRTSQKVNPISLVDLPGLAGNMHAEGEEFRAGAFLLTSQFLKTWVHPRGALSWAAVVMHVNDHLNNQNFRRCLQVDGDDANGNSNDNDSGVGSVQAKALTDRLVFIKTRVDEVYHSGAALVNKLNEHNKSFGDAGLFDLLVGDIHERFPNAKCFLIANADCNGVFSTNNAPAATSQPPLASRRKAGKARGAGSPAPDSGSSSASSTGGGNGGSGSGTSVNDRFARASLAIANEHAAGPDSRTRLVLDAIADLRQRRGYVRDDRIYARLRAMIGVKRLRIYVDRLAMQGTARQVEFVHTFLARVIRETAEQATQLTKRIGQRETNAKTIIRQMLDTAKTLFYNLMMGENRAGPYDQMSHDSGVVMPKDELWKQVLTDSRVRLEEEKCGGIRFPSYLSDDVDRYVFRKFDPQQLRRIFLKPRLMLFLAQFIVRILLCRPTPKDREEIALWTGAALDVENLKSDAFIKRSVDEFVASQLTAVAVKYCKNGVQSILTHGIDIVLTVMKAMPEYAEYLCADTAAAATTASVAAAIGSGGAAAGGGGGAGSSMASARPPSSSSSSPNSSRSVPLSLEIDADSASGGTTLYQDLRNFLVTEWVQKHALATIAEQCITAITNAGPPISSIIANLMRTSLYTLPRGDEHNTRLMKSRKDLRLQQQAMSGVPLFLSKLIKEHPVQALSSQFRSVISAATDLAAGGGGAGGAAGAASSSHPHSSPSSSSSNPKSTKASSSSSFGGIRLNFSSVAQDHLDTMKNFEWQLRDDARKAVVDLFEPIVTNLATPEQTGPAASLTSVFNDDVDHFNHVYLMHCSSVVFHIALQMIAVIPKTTRAFSSPAGFLSSRYDLLKPFFGYLSNSVIAADGDSLTSDERNMFGGLDIALPDSNWSNDNDLNGDGDDTSSTSTSGGDDSSSDRNKRDNTTQRSGKRVDENDAGDVGGDVRPSSSRRGLSGAGGTVNGAASSSPPSGQADIDEDGIVERRYGLEAPMIRMSRRLHELHVAYEHLKKGIQAVRLLYGAIKQNAAVAAVDTESQAAAAAAAEHSDDDEDADSD